VGEFAMGDAPMMAAIAGQDRISRARVNSPFRSPYDGVHVGKVHVDLALQLLRLDMLRVA
jgi:hypothetical protein